MVSNLMKYSLGGALLTLAVMGGGCSTPAITVPSLSQQSASAKETPAASSPGSATTTTSVVSSSINGQTITIGDLRLKIIPRLKIEKIIGTKAYLIPPDQNKAKDKRVTVEITPGTTDNFKNEQGTHNVDLQLMNGESIGLSGVAGALDWYMVKIDNRVYNVVWDLSGTCDNSKIDVPGCDLDVNLTTQDTENMMKTAELSAYTSSPTTPSKIIETGYAVKALYKSYLGENYNDVVFTAPDKTEYHATTEVVNKILSIGTENTVGITTDLAISDPKNSKIIYFTTSVQNSDYPGFESGNILYSYDLKTEKLHTMYSDVSKEYTLSTVAREGTKIILANFNFKDENSPGPCTSFWTMTSFKYFDLASPQKGLQTYNVPADKLTAEHQKEQKCEASDVKELM